MSAAAPVAPAAAAPAPVILGHGITAIPYLLSTGETMVRIQGETRNMRSPVHFLAILDLSGSMAVNDKLDDVIRSLCFMLDLMTPEDRISLITFSSEVQVRFKQIALTSENKEAVRFALNRLIANGGTNLSSGIMTARECLYTSIDATIISRMKQGILVLTDGHANVGVQDPPSINRLVTALLADYPGLTLTTVGYGTDHNAELLTQIAAEGSGSYNVVNNLEDVATVFGDVLGGLQTCLAQEVKLIIPDTATQITPFPGGSQIVLGDLQAGGEHIVLLKDLAVDAPLTLKAYETETGRPIVISLPIRTISSDGVLPEGEYIGQITLMRIRVVNFLKRLKETLTRRSSADRDSLQTELRTLRAALTAFRPAVTDEPNPLLALLIDELDAAEIYLTAPTHSPALHEMTSVLTQHTSHLGACRGVRATHSTLASVSSPLGIHTGTGAGAGASAGAGVSGGATEPAHFSPSNIFATPTQSERSAVLRATSSAASATPSYSVHAPPPLRTPRLARGHTMDPSLVVSESNEGNEGNESVVG